MATMIDGFPVHESSSDHEIQIRIDEFLSQARADARGWVSGTPVPRELPLEEQAKYVLPLLRRARWMAEHPELANPQWVSRTLFAVRDLLGEGACQTETELQAILEYAGLIRTAGHEWLAEAMPRIQKAIKTTRLRNQWTAVIRRACVDADLSDATPSGCLTSQLAYAQFIFLKAELGLSPCVTTTIGADVHAMPVKRAAAWRGLFSLVSPDPLEMAEPSREKLEAAVKRIGPDEFVSQFTEWMDYLNGPPPAYLSWWGVTVIRALLSGAWVLPGGSNLRPPLETLCTVVWLQPGRAKHFVDLLAEVAGQQPFAAEVVPVLAEKRYARENGAVLVAMADQRAPELLTGVDGYPLTGRPEHTQFQHRINEWFKAPDFGVLGPRPRPSVESLARTADGVKFDSFFEALMDRLEWLTARERTIENAWRKAELLRSRLARLLADRGAVIEREGLLRLVRAIPAGALGPVRRGAVHHTVLDLVERYAVEHELDLEFAEAIDAWQDTPAGPAWTQKARQQLSWLLWRYDPRPVSGETCWSARVKGDIAGFEKGRRRRWLALLSVVEFGNPERPSPAWKRAAAPRLRDVGVRDFADSLLRWLEPLGTGQPQPLEVSGRNLLRCLLWHAAEVKDPAVDQALFAFSNAAWTGDKSSAYAKKLASPVFA